MAVVSVTDANFYCAACTTYSDGAGALGVTNVRASSTYVQWNTPQDKIIQTVFSGTSVGLNVDVSMCSSLSAIDYPVIAYSVDGAALTRYQLLSTDTVVSMGTGLANTTHTLRVVYSTGGNNSEKWTPPLINILRITGLTLDTAAVLSAPTLFSPVALFFGDSITCAAAAVNIGTLTTDGRSESSYAALLSSALGCEPAIIGYAGTGYESGAASVPNVISAYDLYYAGKSRLFSGLFAPQPNYVFINHGINGVTTQGDVTSLLTLVRAAAPLARIFVVVPCNGAAAATLAAGVAAFADANTILVNTGVTSYGTTDGLHLTVAGHLAYKTDILARLPMGFAQSLIGSIDATQCGAADSASFPLSIILTHARLKTVPNGGFVQSATGYDIRPFAGDLLTALPFELVAYDGSAGTVEMHALHPLVTHATNATVALFYSNTAVTTDGSSATAWPSAFKGVWHLKDNAATTTVLDSTSLVSTGTNVANTSTKTVTGQLGKALTYNGTTDYTETAADVVGFNGGTLATWSCWVKFASLAGDTVFLSKNTNSAARIELAVYTAASGLYIIVANGASNSFGYINAAVVSTGVWAHVVLVYDGTQSTDATRLKAYVNGTAQTLTFGGTIPSTTGTGTAHMTLGARTGGSAFSSCVLDEVRVAVAARSPSWLIAEYNNQRTQTDTGDFITWTSTDVGSSAQAVSLGMGPTLYRAGSA